MKYSLLDLRASGGQIAQIIGTNCIKDGEWLTFPMHLTATGGVVYGLFVPKADVERAQEIFPDAILMGAPVNGWLVHAQ